jgi:3-dehydroquinate synthase
MSRVHTLPIQTASASYDVLLGQGLLASLPQHMYRIFGERPRRTFVVTSPEIWSLWSDAVLTGFPAEMQPTVLLLPAGEQHKRLAALERLAQQLAAAGADRSSILIAFGGGVIGDVTGFLASIYMRGIDFIQAPTTLLAQVDSSVGGKTGVNLSAGKNLIGTFYHPRLVLADTTVLRTLPLAELRAGLFESLKAGLIYDADLFAYIEQHTGALLRQEAEPLTHVIAESVRIKADVVGKDEREAGLRMILNFGHTIGHAIESATNYEALLHGEAVGIGMSGAAQIAVQLGKLDAASCQRLQALLKALGLPYAARGLAWELVREAMSLDKKTRSGRINWILPTAIGSVEICNEVPDEVVEQVLRTLLNA